MAEEWKMTRAQLIEAIEDYLDQTAQVVQTAAGGVAIQFPGAQMRIHLKDRPDGTCYVTKIEGDKSAYKCINLLDMPDGRDPDAKNE